MSNRTTSFWPSVRAVKYLLGKFQKDAILSYGETHQKDFYVRRNKSSITIRPCMNYGEASRTGVKGDECPYTRWDFRKSWIDGFNLDAAERANGDSERATS